MATIADMNVRDLLDEKAEGATPTAIEKDINPLRANEAVVAHHIMVDPQIEMLYSRDSHLK
jgi:hypothetical protein